MRLHQMSILMHNSVHTKVRKIISGAIQLFIADRHTLLYTSGCQPSSSHSIRELINKILRHIKRRYIHIGLLFLFDNLKKEKRLLSFTERSSVACFKDSRDTTVDNHVYVILFVYATLLDSPWRVYLHDSVGSVKKQRIS